MLAFATHAIATINHVPLAESKQGQHSWHLAINIASSCHCEQLVSPWLPGSKQPLAKRRMKLVSVSFVLSICSVDTKEMWLCPLDVTNPIAFIRNVLWSVMLEITLVLSVKLSATFKFTRMALYLLV